jgi:Protein kinase domain
MWKRAILSRYRLRPRTFVWVGMGATLCAALSAATTTSRSTSEGDEGEKEDKKIQLRVPHSLSSLFSTATICEALAIQRRVSPLRRHKTAQQLEKTAAKVTIQERYDVDWKQPLGEGSFGSVHTATDRKTGETVAVKKISKKFTDNVAFQREMDALLQIRQAGGHPNICGLRENFDDGNYYYLVIDFISGGEMFDHLCIRGPYSEADAARLVREAASALAYLHGINIVHGDVKPENLMLSSEHSSDAVIKVVDFGCAQVTHEDDVLNSLCSETNSRNKGVARTPAYCPPEVLETVRESVEARVDPSFDMWVCYRGLEFFIV